MTIKTTSIFESGWAVLARCKRQDVDIILIGHAKQSMMLKMIDRWMASPRPTVAKQFEPQTEVVLIINVRKPVKAGLAENSIPPGT